MAKERVVVAVVVVRRSEEDNGNEDVSRSDDGRLTTARWLVRMKKDIVGECDVMYTKRESTCISYVYSRIRFACVLCYM